PTSRKDGSKRGASCSTQPPPHDADDYERHAQAQPRQQVVKRIANEGRKQPDQAQQGQHQRPAEDQPEPASHALPSDTRPPASSSARRLSKGALRRPSQR